MVGLVRSLAVGAYSVGFTINAVCPGVVATGLLLGLLMQKIRPEWLTPMERMMEAFDELMDDRKGHNGQTVEIFPEGLYYREPPQPVSHSVKSMASSDVGKTWYEVYVERNKAFVYKGRTEPPL